MEQTTVSSRIPETLNESLERASESRGVFQSEIVRRALRYYVDQNPDNLDAFKEAQEAFIEKGLGSLDQAVASKKSSDK